MGIFEEIRTTTLYNYHIPDALSPATSFNMLLCLLYSLYIEMLKSWLNTDETFQTGIFQRQRCCFKPYHTRSTQCQVVLYQWHTVWFHQLSPKLQRTPCKQEVIHKMLLSLIQIFYFQINFHLMVPNSLIITAGINYFRMAK